MSLNSTHSPSTRAVIQSDTTVFDPPLSGVYILAPGDLSYKNDQDTTLTITFADPDPAGATPGIGSYPFRFDAEIRQILDTNTTIADGDMIAFL
jgi:hypothetical protein